MAMKGLPGRAINSLTSHTGMILSFIYSFDFCKIYILFCSFVSPFAGRGFFYLRNELLVFQTDSV